MTSAFPGSPDLLKQAGPGAEQARFNQALQAVLGIGLGGLGVGAGARSLLGVRDLLLGGRNRLGYAMPVPTRLPVPVPEITEDEEEEPLRKTAALISKEAQLRWQVPASAALGIGGVAGGWKLMDAILDSRRRAEIDQELADVQSEYEEALRDQYEAALTKRGALDDIFEKLAALEKQGFNWPDAWEAAIGTYLTALGATTTAGAVGGYHWAKARGRKRKLEEALQRRKRLASGQPEPLYAYPVPVHYPPRQQAQEEEERELA